MKHIVFFSFILFILSALSFEAHAVTAPIEGKKDKRIKTFEYHDETVYRFKGHYGFSTVIEFSPNETVDSVSIGDSEAWQIVNSNKANILFVKPLLENAYTNMTVLTSKRMYSFEMSAGKASSNRSSELAFRVKFDYPEDKKKKAYAERQKYDPFENKDSDDFNFKYSYAGSNRLKPMRAFDDGTHTYMRFKKLYSMPAVFAVKEDGSEELVNFTMKDDYMVISSIGSQFTLRGGDIATCIFNDLLQEEDTIQKEPKSIDDEPLSDIAIPFPEEKPYFTAKNKDGFFSIFKSTSYEERKARSFNE